MKDKIYKQTQWWKYAAGTLPVVCLFALFFIDIIGWQETYKKFFFAIVIVFVALGGFWWWWAIDKIVTLTSVLLKTEKIMSEIQSEIKFIKNDVKSLDERNKI
jgi:hypothetical protein